MTLTISDTFLTNLEYLLTNDRAEFFKSMSTINVPSQGGAFMKYNVMGAEVNAQTITGVIIGYNPNNTRYFLKSGERPTFTPTADEDGVMKRPVCSSKDGVTPGEYIPTPGYDAKGNLKLVTGRPLYGVGSPLNPTGLCTDCPDGATQVFKRAKAEGTTEKPACQWRHDLYLLEVKTDGTLTLIPRKFSVPPTSWPNLRGYATRLRGEDLSPAQVLTTVSLDVVPKKGYTPAYSKFAFSSAGFVPREYVSVLITAEKMFKDFLDNVTKTPNQEIMTINTPLQLPDESFIIEE